jgi:glycogen operon protein
MRGDKGLISEVATRLAGSSDLYQASGRLPINSVNFVTCHDGFTLYDLVSYNTKHNEANGEGDRDGMTENFGWNCGHEGPTGDRAVLCLRQRLARNYVAVLLLSQGVPMVLAGDEVLRTQRGNNNAYCQDNEISWFDWNLIEKNKDMLAFVQNMIAFRKRHPCLRRTRFLSGNRTESSRLPDITWHGVRLHEPPWDDPDSQVLAFTLGAITAEEEDLHVMINVSESPVDLALPTVPGRAWCRVIDTWETSPLDFLGLSEQRPVRGQKYRIFPHSVVVLESRPAPGRA